jgi:hypothetical protein
MWKKLYTNSGLILLAILGAGVWFSNLYPLYPAEPKPLSEYDNVPPASPTPTTTPNLVELYEQLQLQLQLQL